MFDAGTTGGGIAEPTELTEETRTDTNTVGTGRSILRSKIGVEVYFENRSISRLDRGILRQS